MNKQLLLFGLKVVGLLLVRSPDAADTLFNHGKII